MDCRQVTFSPEKSQQRIDNALQVFPRKLLMRLLAFALHLLGARRKEVAALVEMPEESVKTLLRLVSLDGFAALRDRRCGASVTRQANRPTMRLSRRPAAEGRDHSAVGRPGGHRTAHLQRRLGRAGERADRLGVVGPNGPLASPSPWADHDPRHTPPTGGVTKKPSNGSLLRPSGAYRHHSHVERHAPAWWCQRLSRGTARAANLAAVAPSSDRRIGRCAGCAQHHRSRARLLAQYRAPLDCASQGNRGARGSCPVGAPGHLPAGGAAAHRGVLLPNPATARRRKMDTAMGRAPSAGGHEHRRWVLVKSFDHCVKI